MSNKAHAPHACQLERWHLGRQHILNEGKTLRNSASAPTWQAINLSVCEQYEEEILGVGYI